MMQPVRFNVKASPNGTVSIEIQPLGDQPMPTIVFLRLLWDYIKKVAALNEIPEAEVLKNGEGCEDCGR